MLHAKILIMESSDSLSKIQEGPEGMQMKQDQL
jgi:hypothetical protein